MKTIKDLNQPDASATRPTHVYDRQTKKIRTTEMHDHMRAVHRDMAKEQEDLTARMGSASTPSAIESSWSHRDWATVKNPN
jgi:hypothetical protein